MTRYDGHDDQDALCVTSGPPSKARAMHARYGRILVALVVVVLGVQCSGQAASATPGDGLLSILVMGDSYSAGNGAGSYFGAKGCRRSAHNYGEEFARLVRAAANQQKALVRTVACSGDTTAAFASKKSGRPAQLDAVNGGYDVIFLTIGGNDLQFAKIVQYCLIATFRDGANCGSLLAQAEMKLRDGTIEARLSKVLDAVRAKASPSAKIVLLGYPYLEGDLNYRLRSGHGGHSFIAVGKRLRNIEDAGDAVQQKVVDALNASPTTSGLVFVKTKTLFAGPPNHELFAQRNNSKRWFVQPYADAGLVSRDLWYHPNKTGWSQEARLLAADPRVPRHDSTAASPAGNSIAALLGRWSGPIRQTPPAYTDYSANVTVDQLERVGDIAGQIDYPELSCGGTLTYLGPSDTGGVLLLEKITYGVTRCIDAGTVRLTPIENGTRAYFYWTKAGDSHTADGVLRHQQ